MTDKKKDITGASEHTILTRQGISLDIDSFLPTIINKLELTGGILQYPFVDAVRHDDASYVLGSVTLDRQRAFSLLTITDETVEDANPVCGVEEALYISANLQNIKAVENNLVIRILADASITVIPAALPWDVIKDAIADMGSVVYTIEGSIVAVVSQNTYLNLIGDAGYNRASKVLGSKLKVFVSEHIGDEDIIVFHEHGVAGGYTDGLQEKQRKPALGLDELLTPYSYAAGWDYSYIRIAKVGGGVVTGEVDTDAMSSVIVTQLDGTEAMTAAVVTQLDGSDALGVLVVVKATP